MQRRLRALLPPRWFSAEGPNLAALLNSLSTTWTWIYAFVQYVIQQTRINTATEHWLDLIASDFLGVGAERLDRETDTAYRERICYSLFREAATRPAIVAAIEHVTGSRPSIFEPANPADTGSYGARGPGTQAAYPGCAYGMAGGWGSLSMPLQFLLSARRPAITDLSSIAGYGTANGGYGTPMTSYVDLALLPGSVADNQIYSAVSRLLPINTIAWVRIH